MVLGASIAGLAAASVLSRHFDSVVVVDKDIPGETPEPRRGVPQGTQVHGLQPYAAILLDTFLPGVTDTLIAAGAVSIDFGTKMRSFLADGWVPGRPMGRETLSLTRPFLEHHVRAHAEQIDNVTFAWGHRARRLAGSESRVTGVVCEHEGVEHAFDAGLVVDASGRGTRAGAWLRDLGYGELRKSSVFIDVRYVTCNYTRPPDDLSGVIVRHYPHCKLGAALLPVENDQWLLSLSGRFGVYARKDHEGFMASAAELPIPDVHDMLSGRPATTPVTAYNFAHNQLRHYEAMQRLPSGFVAIGDSALALNPLYGQGMTSALAQAELLGNTLSELLEDGATDAATVSAEFIPRQAEFLAEPWRRALLGDTIFSEAHGDLPGNLDEIRARDAALAAVAAEDREVAKLLAQVTQFAAPAAELARPEIVRRVDEKLAGNVVAD